MKLINIACTVLAIGLAVAAWITLPEMVSLQFIAAGQAGIMVPKMGAILIPLVIALFGCLINFRSNDDMPKGTLFVAAGIALMFVIYFLNV